jgi:transposase
LDNTLALWDRLTEFYVEFFLVHSSAVEAMDDAKELLTWAESRTVPTGAHPHPLPGWNLEESLPGIPAEFRRAAINAAAGAVRSYLSNLRRWEKTDPKKRGKEPRPPRCRTNVTLYGGLCRIRMADFRQRFVRVKLYDGARWRWFNLPVDGPPFAAELFAASEAERERIKNTRRDQNRRLRAEGRKKRTDEEKRALRPAPAVWVAQSPLLVRKGDRFELHVPFEKLVKIPGKAEEQRVSDPDLRVGTVDLNENSAVAATWEGHRHLGIRTVWHARESAKREKALQKVARKQRRSGSPVKGERSNRDLWAYIRNLDDSLAWQVAAAIVAWAAGLGLRVLVFEHLRQYRPKRGLSWSRRTNRKRSYWLRGKVLERVRHLALMHGILVVERNPAWTSQACPRCSRLGERFSPNGRGYPSRFRCGYCGWTGDANVVAALNLKKKWDRIFRYPTPEERKAAEQRRARKGGAAASPEQVPAAA